MTKIPPQTWVLLRGLTREAGHWGDFARRLEHALPPGSQVLTPDLPGNGARWQERSPASVAHLRADLVRWLDREREAGRVRGPVHLLAMSLGAMVAIDWAHQDPQALASMVLINTSVRPGSPFWQRLRPSQYARVLAVALGCGGAQARERHILRMTCRHPPHPRETLAVWVGLRHTHPVSAGNALRQLWAAMRHRAPPKAPAVRTLLLHSACDALVHPACTLALARAMAWPREVHPSAGHDLPQDDAGWVVAQCVRHAQPG